MNNKTSILKKLIEQIVSKEVERQLPILLQELLSDQPQKQPVNSNKGLVSLMEDVAMPEKQSTPVISKPVKKYTNNSMINSILNDTVNDLHLREGGRAPNVGLAESFGMNSVEGGQLNESVGNITGGSSNGVVESVLDLKGKSDAVDNLMKWDFKAILAKSKKK